MQKGLLKNIPALLLLLMGQLAWGQTSSFRLKTADSLFQAKQYTQSFGHYKAILENHEYTEAMLLKMAFIQEGLGHTGHALYYLSLYEKITGDNAAALKMEELATKHNLEGYQPDDVGRLMGFYSRYHRYFTFSFAAVSLLFLALAFNTHRKGSRPIGSFVATTVMLILLFVHLQAGSRLSRGIVAQNQTFLMSGPSSGADVVEILSEGHRVEVIGHTDVWLKVRWDGSVVYVKENNLLPVRL